MNIKLEIAKRATEILQERDQAINYLNINAALKQAEREFSKGEKIRGDFKRVIRGFIY